MYLYLAGVLYKDPTFCQILYPSALWWTHCFELLSLPTSWDFSGPIGRPMDRWRSQDDRYVNRQDYHQANFGEGNVYAIPDNGFFCETRITPNPRCPNSSSVPPYSSSGRPYNPGAEQELRLLNPSGSAYQPSLFAQDSEQGSGVPNYHGPWTSPNTADRYSYSNHKYCQTGVHSGTATGGSTCFKQTVHGSSPVPQYRPQAPAVPRGNPHYHGLGPPWSHNDHCPQSDRSSHMVPSSRRTCDAPRTLGSYDVPIDTAPAAPRKGETGFCNQRPQSGVDRSRLLPENYTLRRPFGESHVYDIPGVASTVPVLEKSKSTPSRPKSNASRPPHSLEEDQIQEKDRIPKPTRSKPGKPRVLTPAGRDHAKAIRQFPGGACEYCKRKKTKARCPDGAVCLQAFLTFSSAFTGYPRMLRS